MIAAFVAGSYVSTYQPNGAGSAISLGLTKEGFRLRWQISTDNIEMTDGFARTCVEQFYEGLNMWIGGIFMTWAQTPVSAVSQYSPMPQGTAGAGNMTLGIISRAATGIGGPLLLSATSGTPANPSGVAGFPLTVTAAIAIQDAGFNVEMLLGPTHREIPFLFRIIPTHQSGDSALGGATFLNIG